MNLRITNKMLSNNFLTNMYGNINNMSKYQHQLATGKRMQRLSDDPAGALRSLNVRVKIYRGEQYQRNIDSANTWLKQSESALMNMNEVFQRAYELAVQVTSDTYNPDDKAKTAEEIKQLRDQILDLANSQELDQYLFAGHSTLERPFTVGADGYVLYKGTMTMGAGDIPDPDPEREQEIKIEIGYGLYCDCSFNGIELMGEGEDNMYNMMQDFYLALTDPNVVFDDLSPYISKFQGTQREIMAKVADVGGRSTRLDMVSERYKDDNLIYNEVKSKIEDISEAEAIMNFKMAQAVYDSALMVGAQILQNTLLNYL